MNQGGRRSRAPTSVYRFVYLHLVHSINPSTLIMHLVFTFFLYKFIISNSHEIHYKMSELHPYFFQICHVFYVSIMLKYMKCTHFLQIWRVFSVPC
jgi:hypothetical protein